MTVAVSPLLAASRKVWESELIEHIATYAAQNGDTDLEQTCDEVLAGLADECVLLSMVREDAALTEWCSRDRRYATRGGGL